MQALPNIWIDLKGDIKEAIEKDHGSLYKFCQKKELPLRLTYTMFEHSKNATMSSVTKLLDCMGYDLKLIKRGSKKSFSPKKAKIKASQINDTLDELLGSLLITSIDELAIFDRIETDGFTFHHPFEIRMELNGLVKLYGYRKFKNGKSFKNPNEIVIERIQAIYNKEVV
jgi:hypothetical protein